MVQFPVTLPQNIAARHRICTSIATKIKELGFLSDCGYNQLLYPVENQTRELLKWLVDKLPRSEEEGAQEALGANALMNRRIMQSLKDWKNRPLKLQFCSKGTVLRNVYEHRQFRTIPGLLEKRGSDVADIKTLHIFHRAAESKISVESSLFERHTLELVADAAYALRLEQDFAEAELAVAEDQDGAEHAVVESTGSEKKTGKTAGALTQKTIRAALLKVVKNAEESGDVSVPVAGSTAGVEGTDGGSAAASRARLAKKLQQGQSLQDTIQNIINDHGAGMVIITCIGIQMLTVPCCSVVAVGGCHAVSVSGDRGTRFSHAVGKSESLIVAKRNVNCE